MDGSDGSGGVVTSGVGEGEGEEDGTGVEGAAVRVCKGENDC